MPIGMKALDAREVPVSPTRIYTVPTGSMVRVLEVLLSNNAGAARTVKVWFVESGASRGDENEISGGGIAVPTGIPFAVGLATVLASGEQIYADADGADVAIRISGIEES